MSNQPPFSLEQPQQIPRRTLLEAGAGAVALHSLPWIGEVSGEVLDTLASPEKIINRPITALEPRKYELPLVSPSVRSAPTYIPLRQTAESRFSLGDTPLYSEHTGRPIQQGDFSSTGVSILTSAEGLVKGEQAYCTLFSGQESLAIGFEGGLYVYESGLRGRESSGEWVRVVTKGKSQTPDSPVVTDWKDHQTQQGTLIEKVVQGAEMLKQLGYRPWAATLPSTKMPHMLEKHFSLEMCAQDEDDAINRKPEGQFFFISNKGDIVDLVHLRAKAGETFDLFMQLSYLQHHKKARPQVGVRYSQETNARFEYSLNPDSLRRENSNDLVFSVMTTTSMLMEGVSQRFMYEKIPTANLLRDMGGLSAEDPFSNSLGIVGMISLLHNHQLAKNFEKAALEIGLRYPNESLDGIRTILEQTTRDMRRILSHYVVAQTVNTLGVRRIDSPFKSTLPRGLSPLVPTKVNVTDAATPTRIDLRAAGIHNTPQTFKPIHVPAMETSIQRVLAEIGLYY